MFQWKGVLHEFLMSVLTIFFSAKSFHQNNEGCNIFATEILHKNYNSHRQHASNGSFSRGTNDCLRCVDISASEFGAFNEHSKVNTGSDIDFSTSRSINSFTEYNTKSATRESGKNKNPIQRASTEVTSNVRELRN